MRLPEDLWYPVIESRELKKRPLGVERLGQRLVLWRSAAGAVHAHRDRCPHLGAALSGGRVRNGALVCPFHGFEFGPGGQCLHIPAIGRAGRIPKAMALASFAVREAHGFVWLWHGQERETYPEPPFFSLPANEWRSAGIVVDWPVHYTRAIENQLDVAHLAFVHRTTIGSDRRSLVEGPYVENDGNGIRVWVTNARDDGQGPRDFSALAAEARTREPTLDFLFPGLWQLTISSRLKNLIAFVPINEHRTRYYMRVYHRYRNPLIGKPFELAMCLSNRLILGQDRRVVLAQTPRDSADADDRLIGADRAIARFRRELDMRLRKDERGSVQRRSAAEA